MFNPTRIRHDFNEAASRYDAHASLQERVLRSLLATLPAITPQSSILDAGCGTGALASKLPLPPGEEIRGTGLKKPHSFSIVALDNAHAMCVLAAHSGNLPVNADMAQLPFADHSFDVVFSSLALQWALDWKATLHEWLRVLKPGGTLAMSTFGAGTLHELAQSFRRIDSHAHISEFITEETLKQHFAVTTYSETVTEYYPDVKSLARHLKALGARNKQLAARPGLMTPRQLHKVEAFYKENYGTNGKLPVSWNIIYASLQKP